MSTRTLDFSRHYAARAHHTQRSGPVLGSLPSIHEVEEMLNIQRRNQDALIRIRTAILNQEHAMAEQMAQRKAFKTGGVHDDVHHMAMYQEEYKGSGGFAGPDSKKRRGVSLLWIFSLSVVSHSPYPFPPCPSIPFTKGLPLASHFFTSIPTSTFAIANSGAPAESCPSRSLPQLQPSRNAGMAPWTRRCPDFV